MIERKISKTERWINIIGSLILIASMYVFLYSDTEINKVIIPLVCAVAGWILHENL